MGRPVAYISDFIETIKIDLVTTTTPLTVTHGHGKFTSGFYTHIELLNNFPLLKLLIYIMKSFLKLYLSAFCENYDVSFCTRSLKVAAAPESGKSVRTERVVPLSKPTRGSIGTVPKCGTPANLANSTPP